MAGICIAVLNRAAGESEEAREMAGIARHWIDGGWLESERIADSYNPATGELLGRFADGGEAEARTAVHAARHAFAGTMWGRDRALPGAAGTGRVFEVRAPELAP